MITPMEIQNHEFRTSMRGYEKEAVKHFLFAVAEDFEGLVEQNHKMAQELAVLRERIKDMESRDKILKDTLITAQQVKADLHQNAEKEAELVIKAAHLEAEKIYENARETVEKVRRHLVDVRRVRNDLLAEAEMMVSRFSHFVDAERLQAAEADKLHNFTFRRKTKAKTETAGEPTPVVRKVSGKPARVAFELSSG